MGVKELQWLEKEQNKDQTDIKRHKERLISEIKTLEKVDISNTLHVNKEPKKFGLLWRLKKVLGM